MTSSTNPFAAALEGQKDQQELSHNPSVSSGTVPSSSSAYNPFLPQQDSKSMQQQSNSHLDQQAVQPSQFESANQISAQLSGLDFSNSDPQTQSNSSMFDPVSAASSNNVYRSSQPAQSPPAEPTSAITQAAPPIQISDEMAHQSANEATGAERIYAPPSGPPPDMISNITPTTTSREPLATAAPTHVDSDEAFARQLLAEEEDRVRRRRRDNRNTQQGGARNHSSTNTPSDFTTLQRPVDPNEEKQWNTKEIYWRKRLQRIIIQNENGPCSLIALCNVLLLRGTLRITPDDRPAVSYSYLSSLLGEHLIDVISTSGSENAMDLEAALSILPQTQYGLDVNVRFSSIFGFSVDVAPEVLASSSLIDMIGDASEAATVKAAASAPVNAERQKQRGELALFKLCNVPLVHGWLADKDDKETWAAVVDRAGDYDRALDRVVAGDEMAKGGIVENSQLNNGEGGGGSRSIAGVNTDALLPDQALAVQDAVLISNFLESTATQLTYPGLYALSTELQRGIPYALFRNSHLSVLYRPTEEELQFAIGEVQVATDAAQPQLYQLVTDSTLENEDGIVWESVEDVDGSASRFYDGKFRPSTTSQDFVGRRHSQRGGGNGQVDEDADFAYAQQLQDRESQRARRYQEQHRNQRRGANRTPLSVYPSNNISEGQGVSTASGGNMISRMLANRKAGKRVPSSNTRLETRIVDSTGEMPVDSTLQGAPYHNSMPPQDSTGPGEEYMTKKEKWYKKIF